MNYKYTSFSSQNGLNFGYDQNIDTIENNSESQLNSLMIDFSQNLFDCLSSDNDENLFDIIKVIQNITSLNEYIKVTLEICQHLTNQSYSILAESEEEEKNEEKHQSIIKKIILVLTVLPKNDLEIKNAIIDEIPIDKILEYAIYLESDSIIELISNLFMCLLDLKPTDDEEITLEYLQKFEILFPLFERLYYEKKKTDILEILNIFLYLTQIPTFLEYFGQYKEDKSNSIVDDIMNIVDANNNKILILVLKFSYLIIKIDFDKCENHVDRYIELLGKGTVNGTFLDDNLAIEIVCLTAKIIRYIIKHEFSWISSENLEKVARYLIGNAKNAKYSNKIDFLKCLFTITDKCDFDCLLLILQNSFCSLLVDFLEMDGDDDVILTVLDEVNILADKELKNSGTKNFLYKFLENGGKDFLYDYKENGTNEDIIGEIDVLLENLD